MGLESGVETLTEALYFKPRNIDGVFELMKRYGDAVRIVAGATDVMVENDLDPRALVDITGCGLDYLRSDASELRIGAAVTMADVAEWEVIRGTCHEALADAAKSMGTPQVRNVATIGGNLCTALPSADIAPALIAFDATASCLSARGERTVSVEEFFCGVRKNALKSDEILSEISVRKQDSHVQCVFQKMERATVGDLALVNAAVKVGFTDQGACTECRIVLGAVAPVPLRVREAEEMLEGQRLDGELIERVAAATALGAKPISDVRASAEYRREICKVFVRRGLYTVLERQHGGK